MDNLDNLTQDALSEENDQFAEILQFAMEQEEAEHQFYTQLAQRAENNDIKKLMLLHANQELEHKTQLLQILARHKLPEKKRERVIEDTDLKMSGYLSAKVPEVGNLSYQDALILAIRMERAGENLYYDLAKMTPDPETRELFKFLAVQERKHRVALEKEYDDNIFDDEG
ncbi:ferritin-like domain-containing protein [Magnetococcales bacterium HHB-1]